MRSKLLSLYSVKYNPFRPDVPTEALHLTPAVDTFLRRVELGITDGGFTMVTGDPGTGKTIVMRLLEERLRAQPNVVVGSIEHPQSRIGDFYRELGDLFGVPLAIHNRWGGFKALRIRWIEHIASTLTRQVLIIDEAQEALTAVLSEPRRVRRPRPYTGRHGSSGPGSSCPAPPGNLTPQPRRGRAIQKNLVILACKRIPLGSEITASLYASPD